MNWTGLGSGIIAASTSRTDPAARACSGAGVGERRSRQPIAVERAERASCRIFVATRGAHHPLVCIGKDEVARYRHCLLTDGGSARRRDRAPFADGRGSAPATKEHDPQHREAKGEPTDDDDEGRLARACGVLRDGRVCRKGSADDRDDSLFDGACVTLRARGQQRVVTGGRGDFRR